MAPAPYVGQRASYTGALCTVRYIGPVDGTTGTWLGVEWDDARRGRHDGSHNGTRYFTCLSKSPTAASFIRPSRPADEPRSFLAALRDKYLADEASGPGGAPDLPVVIAGKVAEEKGFDKIRQKFAQLALLRAVLLDGQRVDAALDGPDSIADTCPSVVQLDLSRNLFQQLAPVVDICRQLPALQQLSLKYARSCPLTCRSPRNKTYSGNRFQAVLQDKSLALPCTAFQGLGDLALADTLLSWEELCYIASRCPSLTTLLAGANQLSSLPAIDHLGLPSTLTSISLEYNDFKSISDLAGLSSLTALRNLHLKGNAIATLTTPGGVTPVFPPSLQYLDLSYNDIPEWSFVDGLPSHFPGLTGLRLAHNPVYDQLDAETKAPSSEESHMLTIGRIANLRSLNFTPIKPVDRTNAELFYLSRIAKQLASVPPSAEQTVLVQHPRYAQLCAIHGKPDVIRRHGLNPAFLEARLISLTLARPDGELKTSRIPKSFDMYAVKAIIGKIFRLPPRRLRLVWETGEWDPVAAYDEQDKYDSDHEDLSPATAPEPVQDGPQTDADADDEYEQGNRPGRWIKREVELKDGPKQLGYCVDGMDVRIRVEVV